MSPKLSVERMKKEVTVQEARARALKHLQTTGSGPSQRELAQQQQLRRKQTANVTSSVAQRRVLGLQSQEVSTDTFDPRMRDNTLHAVAVQRAQELQKTPQTEHVKEASPVGRASTTDYNALPPPWQQVVDPTSGDVYYWIETTIETVGAALQTVDTAFVNACLMCKHVKEGLGIQRPYVN